jgi:FdrA protein
MTSARVRLLPDTYVDSVRLMDVTRLMETTEEVERAFALMATPANVAVLGGEGFTDPSLAGARANDLVLAVRGATDASAETALGRAEATLSRAPQPTTIQDRRPPTLERAVERLPGANLALVSVPGDAAALEAHKALSAGMHVLLFSDNVGVEAEAELKRRGADLGLLVMGPGAGTAMLGGTGLGFANAVPRGPIGIVAAAGTGAQEAMSLIARWGSGVAEVIGIGGRDLSEAIGGTMAGLAIRALHEDPDVGVVLVVSKPPAPAVAADLVGRLGSKPAVVTLLGLEDELEAPDGVRVARTLHRAAALAVEAVGLPPPGPSPGLRDEVAEVATRLPERRTAVRGLFSGGTLCYEAMVLLSGLLGPVRSNTPLRDGWGLPASEGDHVCIDLGEEEYTRGRPHPMIDPSARIEPILEQADDPSTAVILLDVVLGYGAHDDPASVLAPACEHVTARVDGPAVVAYVLGTDRDPQGLRSQNERMAAAGCLIAPTAARSALMAAAIASRSPELAEVEP